MYLDLVIFLNTAVNFFLLWLTGLIARQKSDFKRLMLGALLGAVFILFFLFSSGVFWIWLGKVLLPPLMILVSFQPRLLRQGILLFIIFYFYSLALGGLVLACSFWGQNPLHFSGGIYHLSPPSLFYLFLSALILYLLTHFLGPLLLEKLNFHLPAVDLKLELSFYGKNKTLSAFLDTGNMLKEPFSGFPVAVAAYPAVKELLPSEICGFFQSDKKMDWSLLEKALSSIDNAARFSLIPYDTLYGNGFLLGFKPEKVKLWQKGREATLIKKIIVAIQQEDFFSGAGHEVLLPLEVWRCAVREEG